MERTCLRQLDDDAAWQWLGEPRPDADRPIPWRPMRRIFNFNLLVFLPIFGVLVALFGQMWYSDGTRPGILDILGLVTLAAALGTGMAAYATSVYRRSWNRRAASLEE